MQTINTTYPSESKMEETVEILKSAVERFGDKLLLACSFSVEDIILLDYLCKITTKPKILFINTGMHFKETLDTVQKIKELYNIDLLEYKPNFSSDKEEEKYSDLWKDDPDKCCGIRKVEPLERALAKHKAWITGLRREQSPTRKNLQPIEIDKRGMKKFNPLYKWTFEEVWGYIRRNKLPYNPLHDQNYPSIGCEPCTRPIKEGEDIRSGRWSGKGKLECGLHL
ncbi:MAG: phosphoadenylyl-sulfate reductase [Candidatus Hodarchaeales archaeon]